MKTIIAYFSQSGNTRIIAEGLARAMELDQKFLIDLDAQEAPLDGDIYLVGYGVNKGTVPLCVMDLLDNLEGKMLLLFATCGFIPEEDYCRAIERRIEPFIPEDCVYRGIFLCPGKFPQEVVDTAKQVLENAPEHPAAKRIVEEYALAEKHPNQADIDRAAKLVRHRLGLDKL